MPLLQRFTGPGLFLVALLFIGASTAAFYWSFSRLADATAWVRHTLQARVLTQELLTALIDAETGERGYVITSDPRYLAPYHQGLTTVETRLDALRGELSDNHEQVERLDQIAALVDEKLAELANVIAVHDSEGSDASRMVVIDDSGRRIMDQIRDVIATMNVAEEQLLQDRQATYRGARTATFTIFVGFVVATVALLAILIVSARNEIRRRAARAAEQAEYARELNASVSALERERNVIARLNEASTFLQSCDSLKEVGALSGSLMQSLFPDRSGALYVYASSRNQLVRLAAWGDYEAPEVLTTTQCWSLRRGQAHHFHGDSGTPLCTHFFGEGPTAESWCVPLVAHGETVGMVTLRNAAAVAEGDQDSRLVEMAARQLGVAIANLRLRETLKEQTIRDPLTGTFNRRYLEVVAEKELTHAQRNGLTLGLVMFDLDHFKAFNDVHGHPAGDRALIAVTNYVRETIRSSDWLFRYGGEEFVLLMRETTLADAELKVRELCEGVARLTLTSDGTPLPSITISLGLAMFPMHGDDLDALLSRADEALYASKKAGRNRVTLAAA